MSLGFRMVQKTAELERVSELVREPWRRDLENNDFYSKGMTEDLKTESGTMHLRAIQAYALQDLVRMGGVFAPIQVGGGKTLISLLAPTWSGAKRPLLLLPAKLIKKTLREREMLAKHWRLEPVKILSYEILAFEKGVKKFLEYQPDLIIADECHKLKNLRTARTRCVARYMAGNPQTAMLAMSGTMTSRSIKDFWHIAKWCLGEHTPLPLKWPEMTAWADALDEGVASEKRSNPGALLTLCHEKDVADVRANRLSATIAARKGYQRRLIESQGVISTTECFLGPPIYFQTVDYPFSEKLAEAFRDLRQFWETPDGEPFCEAVELWRHARELACGFFYRWNPRPPNEWLSARRAWSAFVRKTISNRGYRLDTEMQVSSACAAGRLLTETYWPWQRIKDTFKPNTETVWIDDGALNFAAKWLDRHEGIAWVEHNAFGQRLSELTGLPFFGAQGQDAKRNMIEDATGPIIASVLANCEGRNLQRWSKNLVVSCPPNGRTWEQLIGRTHRDGQKAESVHFDVLSACEEQENGLQRAYADACYIEETLGQNQKLLRTITLNPNLFRRPEMPNYFSNIETIKPTTESNRNYFLPGRYKVRLESVFIYEKRLGGKLFIVETTCLESDNPDIKPGEQRNWVQSLEMDAAMARIKSFMGAAHGFCPKRNLDALTKFVTKEVCEQAISAENPLRGKELSLQCHNKKSLKTGKDFTVHLWLP